MKKRMEFDSIMTEFEQITDCVAQQDVNGGSIRASQPPVIMKYGVRPTNPPKTTTPPKTKPPYIAYYGIRPTTK